MADCLGIVRVAGGSYCFYKIDGRAFGGWHVAQRAFKHRNKLLN